jgi:hypothetical protein
MVVDGSISACERDDIMAFSLKIFGRMMFCGVRVMSPPFLVVALENRDAVIVAR